MKKQPERDDVVRQWAEKAEHDLRNAEHTLTLEKDCPYDTVCFHAQQCVEKYVKAMLVLHATDFPKTHDIGELVALLPGAEAFPLSSVDQDRLTDHATTARYPGDLEEFTRSEAESAVGLARLVREHARSFLSG